MTKTVMADMLFQIIAADRIARLILPVRHGLEFFAMKWAKSHAIIKCR